MDDVTVLKRQLERAADLAGDAFEPPTIADFVRRRHHRRRTGWSIAAAVATVVAVVVSIGAVHLASGRAHRKVVAAPSPASTVSTPATPAAPPPFGATAAGLALDKWTALPTAPIQGRENAVAIWTGSQMVIWGGDHPQSEVINPYANGAAYDPSTRKWTMLPTSPLSRRTQSAYIWTGHDVFIWGGYPYGLGTAHVTDGALYDPTTKTWRTLPPSPVGDYRQAQARWTGSQVILLSSPPGAGSGSLVLRADAYDPATNRWTKLPDLNLPPDEPMQQFQAVSVGPMVYLWSNWFDLRGDEGYSGIDAYVLNAGGDKWTTAIPAVIGAGQGSPISTGSKILEPPVLYPWCGICTGPMRTQANPGVLVDPTTGVGRPIDPGPVSGLQPNYLWTGAALLAYGTIAFTASATSVEYPGQAAVWDPATSLWTRLPDSPLFSAEQAAVVWTGDRLLIWGLLDHVSHDGSVGNTPTSTTESAGLQFGP